MKQRALLVFLTALLAGCSTTPYQLVLMQPPGSHRVEMTLQMPDTAFSRGTFAGTSSLVSFTENFWGDARNASISYDFKGEFRNGQLSINLNPNGAHGLILEGFGSADSFSGTWNYYMPDGARGVGTFTLIPRQETLN